MGALSRGNETHNHLAVTEATRRRIATLAGDAICVFSASCFAGLDIPLPVRYLPCMTETAKPKLETLNSKSDFGFRTSGFQCLFLEVN